MTTTKIDRCVSCGSIIADDDDEFQEGKDSPELCGICNDSARAQ